MPPPAHDFSSSSILLSFIHSLILVFARCLAPGKPRCWSRPGLTSRHLSLSSAGSWRWSYHLPAIASGSRSMNFEIMTGLIAERAFVWAMLWMYVFVFVFRSRASNWVLRGRALVLVFAQVANALSFCRRMNLVYMSNPKMSLVACCWRQGSLGMMATRSNKVRFLHLHNHINCCRIMLLMVMRSHRDLDCMDGTQRDGYGTEFSRTGGLRGDLVSTGNGFATRIELTTFPGNSLAVFNNI